MLGVVGVLCAAVGCSSGGAVQSGSVPSPASSVGANATSTGVEATPTPLDNGARYFSVVSAVDVAHRTITFDIGSFIEGKRATKIAIKDGVIKKGEQLDGDFYIRNRVKYDRTLPLASDVTVKVVGTPPKLVSGDLKAFADAFASDQIPPFASDGSATYRGKNGRYWLEIKDGSVSAIEEQYLP